MEIIIVGALSKCDTSTKLMKLILYRFVAIESIATLPATVRVARWLMLIANRYGLSQEDNHKIIKVQQQQLALMVSVSRQTTNQILKKMEAQGLIKLSYGEIEILDIENLRKVSDRFKL